MKNLTFIHISVALIIPLLLSTTGCRHGFFNHKGNVTPEEMADKIVEHISSELKLDSKQSAKLEEIKTSILMKRAERKKEIEPLHDEIQKEITSENISKEKLISLLDKMGASHQDMHPFIAEKIIEFQSMLTTEQKELLKKKIDEFKSKHQ